MSGPFLDCKDSDEMMTKAASKHSSFAGYSYLPIFFCIELSGWCQYWPEALDCLMPLWCGRKCSYWR